MLARAALALVTLSLAGVAAGVSAPDAAAVTPDLVPTNPAQTPWDAVRTGGYSTPTGTALAERLGWQLDSTRPTLNASQAAYRDARLMRAAQVAGLVGKARTMTTALKFTASGVLVTAGLIVVEHVVTDWLGQQHKTYIEFDRAKLGGQLVQVTSGYSQGYDWRPAPDFGWKLYDFTPAGDGPEDKWAFVYNLQYGWGVTTAGCTSNCKPMWTGQSSQPFPPKSPRAENCDGTPYTSSTCYGTNQSGTAVGIAENMGYGMTATLVAMDGALVPLKVQLDRDALATGHIYAGQTQCNAGLSVGSPCDVAYIPSERFERLAPRTQRDTPSKTPDSTSTHTATLPNTAAWTSATATLDDECGKAMFNHLAMPSVYDYYGCVTTASDPDTGPTQTVSPQTVTLSRPLVNETYERYVERLRQNGWLGSLELQQETTARDGYGPNAPTRVMTPNTSPARVYDPLTWPATAPTINFDEDLRIAYNPSTAPPAPDADGDGIPDTTGGGGGLPDPDPGPGPGECVCPGWVLDPLSDITFGEKFPFGAFTWVGGLLGSFDLDPVAPAWTLPIAWGEGSGLDAAEWHIDLEDADPFMEVIRVLESVLFAVGTVLWLAYRVLGLGNGPSGGEGLDES